MRAEFDERQLKARRKRTILSALIILVLVPVTMGVGLFGFGGLASPYRSEKFLVISLLILAYILVPFFILYEKRKPKAREILTIAMLSALSVCANMVCAFLSPFQPGTALVLIAGIAFGPEAGFLTGALARLCLNLFTSQGIWTPWQMCCWGILGFLAGLVFNKVDLNRVNARSFRMVQGPVVSIVLSVLVALIGHCLEGEAPLAGRRLAVAAGAMVIVAVLLGYTVFLAVRRREAAGLIGLLVCLTVACAGAIGAHFLGAGDTFLGWKLYAFGALGLLSGLLVQRQRLPVDDLTLSLFGFLTTFILYGGIMNIAAMVMSSAVPSSGISISGESLALLYVSGAPYDLIHALGTAFFLFLFGDKMIRKLERVKIKYGFYR